jgi:hypothetical protein
MMINRNLSNLKSKLLSVVYDSIFIWICCSKISHNFIYDWAELFDMYYIFMNTISSLLHNNVSYLVKNMNEQKLIKN